MRRLGPIVISGFTLLTAGSLVWGWLDPFFFGSDGRTVQGIDFFSTPKAFLNLLDGRSMYDSWGGRPYWTGTSTWYLMHPAFTVLVGSWLSVFEPWTAYWVFTACALGVLWFCGRLFARLARDPVERAGAYGFFLCSFLTYWLLYVGNMHAVAVLSLSLLLVGLFELAHGDGVEAHDRGTRHVSAGLMVSLFSKPVVLLALPVLLLNRATRRVSLLCLAAYTGVSTVFLMWPLLNPEPIGLRATLDLVSHPGFVSQNLDIYRNQFVLNAFMRDNAIHWFNILAQAGTAPMDHIDIFALSTFLNTTFGYELPQAVFKLPIVLVLVLSAATLLVTEPRRRLQVSLLVVVASTVAYFLSYNVVWEYQYTLLFPCFALLFLLFRRRLLARRDGLLLLMLAAFFYLPSPYVLFRPGPFTPVAMNWIRASRVVPALLMFVLVTGIAADRIARGRRQSLRYR